MSSVRPVTDLLTWAARELWRRIRLADTRWALREIHPRHPDRHYLELRKALLEKQQ